MSPRKTRPRPSRHPPPVGFHEPFFLRPRCLAFRPIWVSRLLMVMAAGGAALAAAVVETLPPTLKGLG